MTRILFVVPPNIGYEDFVAPPPNVKVVAKGGRSFGTVITDIPLGVISLSAYVKKSPDVLTKLVDFNVVLNQIKDFSYPSFKDFFIDYLSRSEYKDYSPQILAISSLFTPCYNNMIDLAACCRKLFPGALIVAGGGVPTNMSREIYSASADFDALCYGEGEKALGELAAAENRLQYLEDNPSWVTRKKIALDQSGRNDFIEDLDEIPFYDYDLCDLSSYGINPTILSYTSISQPGKSFPVMSSRGCTHRCCFCSAHTVHGRKMRYHSLPRVKEDIRRLKDDYGAKTIIFQDDHFLADRLRAHQIIDILLEFGLTAFFPNSLALYALDRKMLEALKKVGVRQLVLAVESGSNRVLSQIMHKPLNLDIVRKVADDCRKLGIYTDVNILIGLPGETKCDIEDSLRFLKTIDANWFRINVATPLPGSEMLNVCIEKKYLKGSYIDSGYKKAVVSTEDFTPESIQETSYLLNLELNFVHNSDFRLGNYEEALKGFENAIRAKSTHALAYHYAALCHEKLGNNAKAAAYREKARANAADPFWRRYVELFKIQV